MLSSLWLKLVDLLLVLFNGKRCNLQKCIGIAEIFHGAFLLLDHLAFHEKSGSFRNWGKEGLPYTECRKQVFCKYCMALSWSLLHQLSRRSITRGAWHLSPSQHCFLGLSLTVCFGACSLRACSALDLRVTGFKTLFVHFKYRSSLNELIKP